MKKWLEVLALGIIILAAVKATYRLEKAYDIGLYDESFYLAKGVELNVRGLPEAENAPLYAVWYYLLSLAQPDRTALYYLSYKLLAGLVPLAFYILLRRFRVPVLLSAALALVLLVSRLNLSTWPRISHFTLLIVLAVLLVASAARSRVQALLVTTLGALVISYIRPEYFIAFGLSALFLAVEVFFRRKALGRKAGAALLAGAAGAATLVLALGVPLGGARTELAFDQHFAVTYGARTGATGNLWTNYEQVMEQNFGSPVGLLQAVAKRPVLVMQHILYNAYELAHSWPARFLPELFPADPLSKAGLGLAALGLLLLAFSRIRQNLRRNPPYLLPFLLMLAPALFTALLLSPRDHYMVLLLIPAAAFLTILSTAPLQSQSAAEAVPDLPRLAVLGLLAFALVPSFAARRSEARPVLAAIQAIQALNVVAPVNLLEAEGGYHVYEGKNFHRVPEYTKETGFNRFLADQKINMIVVTGRLKDDARFAGDREWSQFLDDYAGYGFTAIPIPGGGDRLLVDRSLLAEEACSGGCAVPQAVSP